MEELSEVKKEPSTESKNKKNYQYTGNKLVNDIIPPSKKFFQWENDNIENDELLNFEYRVLQKLYSMKDGSIIKSEILANKFKKKPRTINRTLESLITKEYIHITSDKRLIIRKVNKNSAPLPILTDRELYNKYVEENEN
nr:hypothetical protein [uncultured Draconibacterium sp.]